MVASDKGNQGIVSELYFFLRNRGYIRELLNVLKILRNFVNCTLLNSFYIGKISRFLIQKLSDSENMPILSGKFRGSQGIPFAEYWSPCNRRQLKIEATISAKSTWNTN